MTAQRKRQRRPTHREGLELCAQVLTGFNQPVWHKELGVPFEEWIESEASKPCLSLRDKLVLERIDREGPWSTLADLWSAQERREKSLRFRLKRADALIDKEHNDGLSAAISAVEALCQSLSARSSALEHLLDVLSDLKHGIPNSFWVRKSPCGRPPAGAERANFEGSVAAFVEILSWELEGKAAACNGTDSKAKQTFRLAEKMAKHRGFDWRKATPKSLHDRIVCRWGPGYGRGQPKEPKWRMLQKAFDYDELGEYPRERLRCLMLLRSALRAQKNGDSLREWCLKRARAVFAVDGLSSRGDE